MWSAPQSCGRGKQCGEEWTECKRAKSRVMLKFRDRKREREGRTVSSNCQCTRNLSKERPPRKWGASYSTRRSCILLTYRVPSPFYKRDQQPHPVVETALCRDQTVLPHKNSANLSSLHSFFSHTQYGPNKSSQRVCRPGDFGCSSQHRQNLRPTSDEKQG